MNSNAEFNVIAALDLDPIKVKLMHKESGEGWSLEHASAVEFEYRRFLYLMKLFPKEQAAPLVDVDIFWHYHILDTMKYAIDCEYIFGYFLHHYPYSGMGAQGGEAAHHRLGTRMQELYEATFCEAYIRHTDARVITVRSDAAAQNDQAYSPRPDSANTAWCEAAIRNDRSGARRLASGAANTAWCEATAQNDRSYSMGAVSGSAQTAWCEAASQHHRSYAMRPVSAAPTTAWCEAVAQNDHSYSMRPLSRSTQTAWCEAVAQNDRSCSMRAVPGAAKTAWCEAVAQNDSAYQEPPVLAHAA